MREAKLTINMVKSKATFKATMKYPGHIVGQGQIRPQNSNHRRIPYPHFMERTCQISSYGRILQAFLFKFFVMAAPLTYLFSKRVKFVWTDIVNGLLTK